jgi:hypothetical protein
VNGGTRSPTALIVDNYLGFLLWLGEILTESGYQTVPALQCRQALTLVKKLALRIDLLVLNPELRGAARTMDVLAAEHPRLRVVLIRDPSTPCSVLDPNHATLERPSAWEPISRPQWITKIRKVLLRSSAVK